MKKIISLILTLTLSVSAVVCLSPTAQASEIKTVNEIYKTYESIVDSINKEESRNISVENLLTLFEDNGIAYDNSYIVNSSEYSNTATIYDFLKLFDESFIHKKGHSFVYPAKNSIWLSSEDWEYMMSHFDEPISMETATMLLKRTADCKALIKAYNICDTFGEYNTMINAFYPEFSSLVEENSSGVKYWLNIMLNDGVILSDNYGGDFRRLLHELAHEASAKKSGQFQKREYNDYTWNVWWKHKPSTIYYYMCDTQELEGIPMTTTPYMRALLKDTIPDNLKETSFYKAYITDDAIANIWGIYGIVQEWGASVIEIRASAISSSIGYHMTETVSETLLDSHYWWRGVLLHYFYELKERYPYIYEEIISNQDLMDIIQRTIKYEDEQIGLLIFKETSDEETLALKAWAEDKTVSGVMSQLLSV